MEKTTSMNVESLGLPVKIGCIFKNIITKKISSVTYISAMRFESNEANWVCVAFTCRRLTKQLKKNLNATNKHAEIIMVDVAGGETIEELRDKIRNKLNDQFEIIS